jgi:hypothetical protein
MLIICCSIFGPVSATYRLHTVDHDRVSRVLAAWSVSSTATRAALIALWGALAAATSPRWALAAAGALLLAAPLLLPLGIAADSATPSSSCIPSTGSGARCATPST